MTMGPMMGWGSVWVLFLAVLVVGIVFLVRTLTTVDVGSGTSTHSALEILEERYTRGDIDREEFEERKQALES